MLSKVLHDGMPLLNDLSRNLDWDALPAARPEHKRLGDDVEQLLSYLCQEMPWKSPEQRHFDMGLFYAIARQIAGYIADCEARAFQDVLLSWAGRLVEHLHRTQATVVTLNYDTALERLTGMLDRDVVGGRSPRVSERIERDIALDDIYRLPMLPQEERTESPLGKNPTPTYRLLKPHGSINWYSLGDEAGGGQVFYDGIAGFYPDVSDEAAGFGLDARSRLRESNRRDLVPLIIPPVAEKSAFYRSHLVKTLWSDFSKAVQNASEIYFVGYSLPKTDLSMRLFLTAIDGDSGKAIYLVNPDSQGDVKANYVPVLPGCHWRDDYLATKTPSS